MATSPRALAANVVAATPRAIVRTGPRGPVGRPAASHTRWPADDDSVPTATRRRLGVRATQASSVTPGRRRAGAPACRARRRRRARRRAPGARQPDQRGPIATQPARSDGGPPAEFGTSATVQQAELPALPRHIARLTTVTAVSRYTVPPRGRKPQSPSPKTPRQTAGRAPIPGRGRLPAPTGWCGRRDASRRAERDRVIRHRYWTRIR